MREWLTDPAFPVDGLVTHRFPLDAFDIALATAAAGEAMGAVKVVFEDPLSPLRQRRLAVDNEVPMDDPTSPVLLATTAARARHSDQVHP